MEPLSNYQVCDAYLVSSLSITFVGHFLYVKSQDPCLKRRWFIILITVWAVLEIVALILFSLSLHVGDIKLPQRLKSTVHVILATISMCGVANIQTIAITYVFAVQYVKREWWEWAVVLEYIGLAAAIAIALIRPTQPPLELAYIVPFTSQIIAIVAIFQASHGKLPEGESKRLANYLLVTSVMFTLLSLLLLGLSLAGFLPRLIYAQCGLFMLSLTSGFRPSEHSAASLTMRLRRRWFVGSTSRHNSYQSLPVGGPIDGPLPPPIAHMSARWRKFSKDK